ncbi:trehalase family glycosidase [Parabacteroides sp. AM08-6]|uniref:trehalase family glycosidase n=1 Tax=Parabacteroides sp. AM08-6 TaxID=2292053 RepID=UPI000EFF90D7|nr:trehalase family glycosidase [Parabacteroides sp. AM08-6]RHJ84340.1 glycoside hydrolase [Parabacteroides sp. AM08-6]
MRTRLLLVFIPLLLLSAFTMGKEKTAVSNPTDVRSRSSYLWYPGQLAAHLQRIQQEKSAARCVNVGYPGKFTQAEERTYFRKKIKLEKDTEIHWQGKGIIRLTLDGKALSPETDRYNLTAGKHTLLFDVQTNRHLPALIVEGDGVEENADWQVSLDGNSWTLPETDARYNIAGLHPDEDQDEVISIEPHRFIPVQNADSSDKATVKIGKNGCILIDFHELEIGTVTFIASGNGSLEARVGESPEEALNADQSLFEQRPIEPFLLNGSNQQRITLPERALRYIALSCNDDCTLSAIRFDTRLYPVNRLMQFESDDSRLNALWNTGVATLHTSMHNFYLDGVKRDYLPWSMDAIISALGGDYVFGDRQTARNGISIALMPANPQTSDWGIVDYPLHAFIGLKQDYLRYGDLTTLNMFKERVLQQMALYETAQDERGFLVATPSSSGFIPGWSRDLGPDDYGVATYPQMMLYENFRIAAYFSRLWKDNSLARHYEQKAQLLGKNIVAHFWDEERKAFINGYRLNGEKDTRISHHAQYWGVLTGLYQEKYYDQLYTEVIPSISYYKKNISYEKGYECLAYAKTGRIGELYALLSEVWGDWLAQGHTRFPENFSLGASVAKQNSFYGRPFGLSLCHGANGTPPILLTLHGIFGFTQSDVQTNEYTLRPDLLHLGYARGRIPVKEGFIVLDLKKEGVSTIEIPAGCTVRLYVPKGKKPLVLKKAKKYEFNM